MAIEAKLTYLELDPANFTAKQKAAARKIEAAQEAMKAAVSAFVDASGDKAQAYYDHIVGNGGTVGGTHMNLSTRFGKYSVFFTAPKGQSANKRSMKL
jgi:hypothetical protein